MDLTWSLVYRDWRLNERQYGALQGLNTAETAKEFGETRVKLWRRSYDVGPPALEAEDPGHPRHDPRYRELSQEEISATECLKDAQSVQNAMQAVMRQASPKYQPEGLCGTMMSAKEGSRP